MKKLLITLTMAGALTVPVGVALAQDEPVEPTDPQTVVEPVRERARQHQEEQDGTCDGTAEMLRVQEREHERLMLQDQSGEFCDCDGDQLRLHDGEGSGPEFGGNAVMQRQGAEHGHKG